MEVVYKTNSTSAYNMKNLVEEMLQDCGKCYIDDTFIDDYSSNNQTYQEYCCEEFGGSFYEFSDFENNYCEGSDASWMKLCSECSNDLGDINGDLIINVLDIISVVNIILNVSIPEDCESNSADFNSDGVINIQDVISIVNEVLG